VPLASVAPWIALAPVIGLVAVTVVYAVYWPAVPSVFCASCESTKPSSTAPVVNVPAGSIGIPDPSVRVKLTVAIESVNARSVTAIETAGLVVHGISDPAPASPASPDGPAEPVAPGGPAGPSQPTTSSANKVHFTRRR